MMKYRTGTLYNRKHAVRIHHSISPTCPLCPQLDSALHIFSGCQHTQIRSMITERHNLACSMIIKATHSKTGLLNTCFVCMDIGSSKRLAMHNLQIPVAAETEILPKRLFPPRFSDKIWFTSGCRINCSHLSVKTKRQQTNNEGGQILRSGRGQLRETGSTSAAPPATSRSNFPRQHRPKKLSILQREIHLIEIKYCEDTRPQNQVSAAQEQHKGLCSILQKASVTLHIILLGVSGTINNNHTLEPFQELGLDSQRIKKLASKLHVHSVNYAAQLVLTRRAFSSPIISSHQETVSGQPSGTSLIFFFPWWGRITVPDTKQRGSFFLINVGSGFHCLPSFFVLDCFGGLA